MSDPETYRPAIRDFVAKAFKGAAPDDEEDIFESGFVNSLFAMELVTFIEGTYHVTIENEDLELENFSTVNRLAALVADKVSAGASGQMAG